MYSVFAVLVKDHKRSQFTTRENIFKLKAPGFAIQPLDHYVELLSRMVPQAHVVVFESPRDFINRPDDELDAMILSAEAAAAWSLLYPEYAAVVPTPHTTKVPTAFPLPRNEENLADYLKIWLELKKQNGTIQRLYDHWVLGKLGTQKEPRWSVIRDVLHWVN